MTPRSRYRGLFVALLAFLTVALTSPAITSASDLVFGPVTCQRGPGAPTVFDYSFTAPPSSQGSIFQVYNGGLEDTTYEQVSSSTITLNGVQIIGPSNFNQKVAYIEAPVVLQAHNTLKVEVRGKLGGAMIIRAYPLVAIDSPAEGQVLGTDSVTVSGHLYSAVTSVSVNGLPGTVSASTFSVTGITLAQGGNTITATATREDGFSGSNSIHVTLDSVPPTIDGLAPAPGAAISEAQAAISASFSDALSGIEASSTRLKIDGADVTPGAVLSEQSVFYRPTTPLPDGAHHITLLVHDRAGNEATASWSIVVDTAPPKITVMSPAEGASVAAATVDLFGSVDDPTAAVTVNGTAVTLTSTNFSALGLALALGPNTIHVEARDALGNSSSVALHVTYVPPPPTVSLAATPSQVQVGGGVALQWTTDNASSVSIAPNIGMVAASGSMTVTPSATTTYTLSATGPGGTATTQVTVTVNGGGGPPPPGFPASTITAHPASIPRGASSTLRMNNPPAMSCSIDQGVGTVQCNGLISVSPAITTTYTLTVIGFTGTTTAMATVTVTAPLPVVTIAASPIEIQPGGSSMLSWSSTNAESCSISGIGAVPLSGTMTVSPNVTTNYQIAANGEGGSKTSNVVVTVKYPVPTVALSAAPTEIMFGESATLSWSSTNAGSCAIDQGIGLVACSGTMTVSPGARTTYTVTATGQGGTTAASALVMVKYLAPTVTMSVSPAEIVLGESATLSWSSTNASYCVINPGIGVVATSGAMIVSPVDAANHTYWIVAYGPGGTVITAQAQLRVRTPAPTVTLVASPERVLQGTSATLTWSATDAYRCDIQGLGSVECTGTRTVLPADTTTYRLSAYGYGGTVIVQTTVTVEFPPVTVSIVASPSTIHLGETTTLSWNASGGTSGLMNQGIGLVEPAGTMVVEPASSTEYVVTVAGAGGVSRASALVTVLGNPQPQPEGSFGSRYQDLIPQDATVAAYDAKRFSLVTGAVRDRNDQPVAGVSVSIHAHPEYGTVLTDDEGRFAQPVEGGGLFTISYRKPGLVSTHRRVDVPWNDIAIAETVTMIPEDAAVTTVSLDGSPLSVATHRSSTITDDHGSRACTMVFTGDNKAYAQVDGGEIELKSFNVRATEFDTPASMPAKLPPNSAYTYCVDMAVDGAESIRFAQPIVTYVDNFLGFPVGMIVPVGYYDYKKAIWIPEDNGVVVRLLDADADGEVDSLDATGDGLPDDLNTDGALSDEVEGLNNSARYTAGATYWRVKINHLTPIDLNWSSGPPEGAQPPNIASAPIVQEQKTAEEQDRSTCTNSYIEHLGRLYHEDVAIPGTGLSLHYSSKGYPSKIIVPVGSSVPAQVEEIVVAIEIGGNRVEYMLPPYPNQKVEYSWDGLDKFGRVMRGTVKGKVNIGYAYPAVYMTPKQRFQAFAQAAYPQTPTMINSRVKYILWQQKEISIDRIGMGNVAEGWSFSNVREISSSNPLALSDGAGSISRRHAYSIETIGGNGSVEELYGSYYGQPIHNGTPAIERGLGLEGGGVAVDASGNVYFSYIGQGVTGIWKIDIDGRIFQVGCGYGTTPNCHIVPRHIALDKEGNVVFTSKGFNQVKKFDSGGNEVLLAGKGYYSNCDSSYSGEDGPATEACICDPYGIAVDNDNNVYVSTLCHDSLTAESDESRIVKISSSGIMSTLAIEHDDSAWRAGDIEVDSEGNIYYATQYSIKKIDKTGAISRIASGDRPDGIALDKGGNLYYSDMRSNQIKKIDTQGIVTTIAGNGDYGFSGDGGLANEASMRAPLGVAVGPDGSIYFADSDNKRIRKIGYPRPIDYLSRDNIMVPGENGLGYVFSNQQKHLGTSDLVTGTLLETIQYDGAGNIKSFTDRFGNGTVVTRQSDGKITSVQSPDGLVTALAIDDANLLRSITLPDGSSYSFDYSNGSLLTEAYDPNGNQFSHLYSEGKLTDVFDPAGGHWTLSQTSDGSGVVTTVFATAEGDQTTYREYANSSNDTTLSSTLPDGSTNSSTISGDRLRYRDELPCGIVSDREYGYDQEFQNRYLKSSCSTTPGGLTMTQAMSRDYQYTEGSVLPTVVTDNTRMNGNTWKSIRDISAAQVTSLSPAGRTSVLKYNTATLMPEKVDVPGMISSVFTYDNRGRISAVGIGDRSTNYSYDQHGYLNRLVTADNKSYHYSYDIMGRLLSETRPDGSVVEYHHDANGNMTALINPLQIDIDFGYTANNQRSTMSIPLSGAYQYHYDRDRRIKDIVMPSGRTIGNVYSAGVLDSTFMPEGTIHYDYGCSGKLTKASFGGENIAMDYDGPLVTRDTRSGTLAESISYVYNNDYLPASVTYSGTTVNFGYDADGLLTSAGDVVISRNLLNGLPESVSSGPLTQSRSFSGFGELDAISWGIGGASPYQWSMTRDFAGRITRRLENIDGESIAWEYAYDSLGRLVDVKKNSAIVESYSYDANGNRLSEMNSLQGIMNQSFSYSVEDHVITAGPDSLVFDVDGFMQSRTTAEGSISYEYSSRGELLRADLIDGKIITYVHDPMGRRIARQVNGATVEKYLWAGRTALLAVYDGNDNLLQRYTYADARMPVSMMAGGATYYLLTDQVGTLRAVADTTGNIVKRIDYDSFGNIIADTNPAFSVPFGFAGGLHDRDTGLVRFGFRDYSPELGRFTAKDPIDFAGGDMNLYAYAMSDPVNFIDPTGLYESMTHKIVVRDEAVRAGMSRPIAEIVARASGGVDTLHDPMKWENKTFHFSTYDEANARLDAAPTPFQLGEALHTLMDVYTHEGRNPIRAGFVHLWQSGYLDAWDPCSERDRVMATDVGIAIRAWMRAHPERVQ